MQIGKEYIIRQITGSKDEKHGKKHFIELLHMYDLNENRKYITQCNHFKLYSLGFIAN